MGERGRMAREVARGEIWMYNFASPDKRRPVLVISREDAIRVLSTVMVAPVTSTIHGIPSEVSWGPLRA
jgi:mRNA interferase MazF